MANGDTKSWSVLSLILTAVVGGLNLYFTDCIKTRVDTLAALVKVKNDAYLTQLAPLREQTREFLLFIGRAAAGTEKGNVDATANENRVKLRLLIVSCRPLVADASLDQSTQALLDSVDRAADDVIAKQVVVQQDRDTKAVLSAWSAFQANVFRVLEASAVSEKLTRAPRG